MLNYHSGSNYYSYNILHFLKECMLLIKYSLFQNLCSCIEVSISIKRQRDPVFAPKGIMHERFSQIYIHTYTYIYISIHTSTYICIHIDAYLLKVCPSISIVYYQGRARGSIIHLLSVFGSKFPVRNVKHTIHYSHHDTSTREPVQTRGT